MTNEENSNCLEGVKCLACESTGPFWIQASCQVLMHDDGNSDVREIQWDDDSAIQCCACGRVGKVSDFHAQFRHVCDNCDLIYADSAFQQMVVHKWPDIPNILERLDVDGRVPSGECPECGALMYRENLFQDLANKGRKADQVLRTSVRKGNEEATRTSE